MMELLSEQHSGMELLSEQHSQYQRSVTGEQMLSDPKIIKEQIKDILQQYEEDMEIMNIRNKMAHKQFIFSAEGNQIRKLNMRYQKLEGTILDLKNDKKPQSRNLWGLPQQELPTKTFPTNVRQNNSHCHLTERKREQQIDCMYQSIIAIIRQPNITTQPNTVAAEPNTKVQLIKQQLIHIYHQNIEQQQQRLKHCKNRDAFKRQILKQQQNIKHRQNQIQQVKAQQNYMTKQNHAQLRKVQNLATKFQTIFLSDVC